MVVNVCDELTVVSHGLLKYDIVHFTDILCIQHYIIGVTLFLSHYYLDPSYQYFNATYPINAVDLFAPSFTVIFWALFSFVMDQRVQSKTGLMNYDSIIINAFMVVFAIFIIFLLEIILVTFKLSQSYYNIVHMGFRINASYMNIILLVNLYIFTLIISVINYLAYIRIKRKNSLFITVLTVMINLTYFTGFLLVLATLVVDTPSLSWEDTIHYSYISVVNLIFVALQVAICAFIFLLSVVTVIKLHFTVYISNRLQYTSLPIRRSDYGSMVICNNDINTGLS